MGLCRVLGSNPTKLPPRAMPRRPLSAPSALLAFSKRTNDALGISQKPSAARNSWGPSFCLCLTCSCHEHRSRNVEGAIKASHAIMASYGPQQQEDGKLFPQSPWPSRLLKNDFSLVVTSTYWITGCEQSQYIVVAQGAERVFQLSPWAVGPRKLMKIGLSAEQNGCGSERQDRSRNGEVEAVQLSDLERA